ncbi:NUDIX domain-containing protein [Streptomyces acidiscabies]|uniref:NUDIX domain-containing protein n=1 Tax=Streptomyces acidiscabies TaxID=42234 RepID=UPI000962277A|nr:NUDIX hydrolase [Streptomyces acidiscabies]GAV38284.1 RNA pyrophosphohydrolase [Streptomyces acidiscabies]
MSNTAVEVSKGYTRDCWPMASGVLILDQEGRVLLVHPTYHKDRWLFPGGGMESAQQDTPQRAAAREVAEELGVALPVGRMLVSDWVMKEGRFFEELVFVFDGGVVDEETISRFRTPDDELRGWEFLDADEAVSRLAPPDGRRLLGALAAKKSGVPVYLEHGHPAPEEVTGLVP